MKPDGRLEGPALAIAALSAEGIVTVADVLARARLVRDLPARSNLVLEAAGRVIRVKREKRALVPQEAAGIDAARAAGAPVPEVAFRGAHRSVGALTGTFDLAPRRSVRDLLAEGTLSREGLLAVLRSLAQAAARLHSAKVHHRDLYLDHVWADPADPGAGVVLIDLERLKRHWGQLGRGVVKDLAAVESCLAGAPLSSRDRLRLLAHYLRARHFPARLLLGPLARRVLRKAARIRAHAPRTPVGAAALPRPPRARA